MSTATTPAPRDASIETRQLPIAELELTRECAWCRGNIGEEARSDSIYCRKSCRQAAHRFRRGYIARPAATGRPLVLCYADPPYPGKSGVYKGHADYAGEVDHRELFARLAETYPDGWALSTNSRSLPQLLKLDTCPADVHVAAWHRGERPSRSSLPLQAWEPVIYRGGRQEAPAPADGPTKRTDSLVYHARARLTDPGRVTGAKPAEFVWWLFDLIGALPGDELVDLFPGSGGVARAWDIYNQGPPDAASRRRDPLDTSPGPRDA